MVYPMGGTDEGKAGDHILLAPPFIVTERDVDDIVEHPRHGHRRDHRRRTAVGGAHLGSGAGLSESVRR